MSVEENKKVVVAFVDAMARHDWPAFFDLCEDDVEWRVPGPPELIPVAGVHRGKDAIAAFLARAVQEFGQAGGKPDLQIKRVTAEGDTVVVEHEVRAVTAKGEDYHNYYCLSYDLKDGRIHRIREYVDSLYAWHKGMFKT